MRASRLIQILAEHMNDPDGGGDFEVYIAPIDANGRPMALNAMLIDRCWLYPGIKSIMISTDGQTRE